MTVRVESGQSHWQLAANVVLAKEGTHGSPLTRRCRTIGGDKDRDLGNLVQEIGAVVCQDDDRHTRLIETLQQLFLAVPEVAPALVRGDPDVGRNDHVRVFADLGQHLISDDRCHLGPQKA